MGRLNDHGWRPEQFRHQGLGPKIHAVLPGPAADQAPAQNLDGRQLRLPVEHESHLSLPRPEQEDKDRQRHGLRQEPSEKGAPRGPPLRIYKRTTRGNPRSPPGKPGKVDPKGLQETSPLSPQPQGGRLSSFAGSVYTWAIRKEALMMKAKLQKWGNSQGLRLSKQTLDLADFAVGDEVEVVVGDSQILIRKTPRPRYDLAELVSRIPKGYQVEEADLGPPVGREEW
jgi:antitoxin MazE